MKRMLGLSLLWVMIVILLGICANDARAQIFDRDIGALQEQVLPIAKKRNHIRLINLIEVVLPSLNEIVKSNIYEIRDRLKQISRDEIIQKDFLLFAYNKAIRMLRKYEYGSWNDAIRQYVLFVSELECPIKEIITLKPRDYQEAMSRINVKLVRGTYVYTLRSLSLLPSFYELRIEKIKAEKRYPKVEEILIVGLVEFADQLGSQK